MQRAVVVFPFVPVTATMGMRALSPSWKAELMMASPTGRGVPSEGSMCMRRPGAAFTSTMAPRVTSSGWSMRLATMSMPATSSPIMVAASMARSATSG